MTLVDGSGAMAQPALPLQLMTLTQEGQEILWTEEGDQYKFSLTPALSGMNRFEIAASFSGAQGTGAETKELLKCAGAVGLRTVEIPVTGPSIALSFVVMPPREPVVKDQPIILPLQLISRLNINEVAWSAESPEVRTQAGAALRARIEPADTDTPGATRREFNLIIDPAGEAGTLAVAVAGLAITAQGPIDIPPARSEIVIPETGLPGGQVCVYDKAWDRWFWRLAVVLAGLLVLLLAFRWSDARTQKDYQVVGSDTFRIRKWRFLFLPLAIMLATLVLNRVWWCYLIPWWLFLASLLGLVAVVFPLAHYIRDEKRRAWALLALFLVAAVLVVFVSITIDRRLLWPLVTVLLLTAIGRWYIRPDERPDPQPLAPAVLSLVSAPACVPFNEPVRLPLRFDYQGGAGLAPSLAWQPSAKILPEGEVGARVAPVDGKSDEYELSIDAVPYQPGARQIRVQVRALAALPGGRSLEIDGQSVTIGLCPPDELADLEGIGEKVQEFLYQRGILTFEQLARAEVKTINGWLDAAGWKMMDAKTWPQQAKLAAVAREFNEEDRSTYLAYKDWLKDGIEPDQYDVDEKDRRSDPALTWNGIPQFTPLVLSLALSPSGANGDRSVRLPVQLNSEGDRVRLASADWLVNAKVLPGEAELEATVKPVDAAQGRYEIVTAPVGDPDAREVRLSILAGVNGRSIEIFYGKALTVGVSPPPAADDLAELEGIEAATVRLLAGMGISTFEQLAHADPKAINACLDEAGQKMRDAKTWPQQARLADIARKYGREEDRRSYQAYKAWLKGGIEPDEYDRDEKDRRPAALAWHGTAELTEAAYAQIFKKQ
jgi:predicted flap endonuclease-1-like 5' DNA nuclease